MIEIYIYKIQTNCFIGLLGTVPVLIVVCLYLLILSKALKKVNEYKNAQSGVETENNLRYFRGGGASDQEDNSESITPFRTTQKLNCFKCCSFEESNKSNKTQPSKWKAIKIVFFTTGSFVFTWVKFCKIIKLLNFFTFDLNFRYHFL